jgi:hypothetical protein
MATYLQSLGLLEIVQVICRQTRYAVNPTSPLSMTSKVSRAFDLLIKGFDLKLKPLIKTASFQTTRKRSSSHTGSSPTVVLSSSFSNTTNASLLQPSSQGSPTPTVRRSETGDRSTGTMNRASFTIAPASSHMMNYSDSSTLNAVPSFIKSKGGKHSFPNNAQLSPSFCNPDPSPLPECDPVINLNSGNSVVDDALQHRSKG